MLLPVIGFVPDTGTPFQAPQNTFNLFLGDANIIPFKVFQGDCQGYNPLDLTSCTEIVVNFLKADGTEAQLKLSLSQVLVTSPPVLGSFTVPISNALSALLNEGTYQSINVTFTIGSLIFTVPFVQALSVFQVS